MRKKSIEIARHNSALLLTVSFLISMGLGYHGIAFGSVLIMFLLAE